MPYPTQLHKTEGLTLQSSFFTTPLLKPTQRGKDLFAKRKS